MVFLVYEWDRCGRECEHLAVFETEEEAHAWIASLTETFGCSYCVEGLTFYEHKEV